MTNPLPENINIIDIEASGLRSDSYPIEIAILVDGKKHVWLIKPEDHWTYWSDDAQDLHGISLKMLQREGLPVATVADELNRAVSASNGLLHSDAVRWDSGWINTLYDAANMRMNFKVVSIYDLLSENQSLKFDNERSKLANSGRYDLHKAEEDVSLIYDAYLNTVRL
jgi:DNA polymerase III epsilon subunit-like protein